PQDGDDPQLLALDHLGAGLGQGGFHLYLLQRQVPRHFVRHEQGDLVGQLPELLGPRLLASQDAQFVLDQRMVDDVNRGHARPPHSSRGFPMRFSLSTRTRCRPPSKEVVSHASTMASASPGPITRAPMASTFASLWARLMRAE